MGKPKSQQIYLDSSLVHDDAPGYGYLEPDYALVGLAPSPHRPKNRFNEPFGAKSWRMMGMIVELLGGNVYLTNLVKSPQPPRRKIKKKLIDAYLPMLIYELEIVKPKRIVAFGAQVAKALCPGFSSLNEDHGTLFRNFELGMIVVPTFHPSALADDPVRIDMVITDMQRIENLPDPEPPLFETLITRSELLKVMKRVPTNPLFYLDLETTGTAPEDPAVQVTKIGFTWDVEPIVYILELPEDDLDEGMELMRTLKRSIAPLDPVIIGHNLPFDLSMLSKKSEDFWDFPVRDTMSMGYVAGEERLGLKHLNSTYTDRPGSRAYGGYTDNAYAAEDVFATREIHWYFEPKTRNIFARNLYEDLIVPVTGMGLGGVKIDKKQLAKIIPMYQKLVDKSLKKLNDRLEHEINWNSPAQAVEALLSLGVRLTKKTATGRFSLAEPVIKGLAVYSKPIKDYMIFKENLKLLNKMLDWQERTAETSYMYPKFKIFGARTGRTSMSNPNLQSVDREGKPKTVFISRYEGGYFGLMDLNQAELRSAGVLSGDEAFCKMLVEEDPHYNIASMVWRKPVSEITGIQRKKSKAVTFGLLYGGSPKGMAFRSGFDLREVIQVKDSIFGEFPGLKAYIDKQRRSGVLEGKVYTIFGKVRDLTSIIAVAGEQDAARKAINTPIQGSASEVTLWILAQTTIRLRRGGLMTRPLFGIHDSVIFDVYPGEEDALADAIAQAFLSLKNTPLAEYRMFKVVPFSGELALGETWARVESTNEDYNPVMTFEMDSLKGLTNKEVLRERD